MAPIPQVTTPRHEGDEPLVLSDARGPETLFNFVPQYPTEGKVPISSFVRIRHRDTNRWLHADFGDRVFHDDRLASDSEDDDDDSDDDDATPKSLRLVASVVRHDEDVFGLQPVKQEAVDDMRHVRYLLLPASRF